MKQGPNGGKPFRHGGSSAVYVTCLLKKQAQTTQSTKLKFRLRLLQLLNIWRTDQQVPNCCVNKRLIGDLLCYCKIVFIFWRAVSQWRSQLANALQKIKGENRSLLDQASRSFSPYCDKMLWTNSVYETKRVVCSTTRTSLFPYKTGYNARLPWLEG